MKSIFIIGLFVTTTAFASLTRTKIRQIKDPTVAQLETAREILAEAIVAKKKGDRDKFFRKLKKAKKFQERFSVIRTIRAAFLYNDTKTKKKNYFEQIGKDDSFRYRTYIQDTCFVGAVNSANRLLEGFIGNDTLNYDEEWYENSRIKDGNTILIEFVDGPNEYTETYEIPRCK